jgi:hypothetical protein
MKFNLKQDSKKSLMNDDSKNDIVNSFVNLYCLKS